VFAFARQLSSSALLNKLFQLLESNFLSWSNLCLRTTEISKW